MNPQQIIEHFEENYTELDPQEAVKKAIDFVKDQGFEHTFYVAGSGDQVWEHPSIDEHNDEQPTVMTKGFFTLYLYDSVGKPKMELRIGRVGNTNQYVKRFEESS